MYCYGSAISTSLAGFGDFFPWVFGLFFLQNYVVAIKKRLMGDRNCSFHYLEYPVVC